MQKTWRISGTISHMEGTVHWSREKGIAETSKGNQYQKGIDDLKRLIGDQALVIDVLKKSGRWERINAIQDLKEERTRSSCTES